MHMVPVAVVVEVVTMTPEAWVTPVAVMTEVVMPVAVVTEVVVPVAVVTRVQVDVPAKMQMPTVAVDMTDRAGMPDETGPDVAAVATMTDDTVVTTTAAAAVRIGIGRGGDKSRQANNGRSDQDEECRTFEHGSKTFGLDVDHPSHWSKAPRSRFKRLISGTFSFIWHSSIERRCGKR
jgi:hypothetical protein